MGVMPSRLRHPRSPDHPRWPLIAGVVALAVLAGSLSVAAIAKSPEPPGLAPVATPTPSLSPEQPLNRKQLADVLPRLEDRKRPFTVAVFGDSTGISVEGWQVKMGEWLGQRYRRPAKLYPWFYDTVNDEQSHRVEKPWTLWPRGAGAPITVWNGSAGGTAAAYARSHWDEMVPVDADSVDLVIINDGHNEAGPQAMRLVMDAAMRYPNAAVIGTLQNPQKTTSENYEANAGVVKDVRSRCAAEKFQCIDIWSAFEATGAPDSLIEKKGVIHPNEQGYALWGVVVIQALNDAHPRS